MKKFVTFLLITILTMCALFALAACTPISEKDSPQGDPDEVVEETQKISSKEELNKIIRDTKNALFEKNIKIAWQFLVEDDAGTYSESTAMDFAADYDQVRFYQKRSNEINGSERSGQESYIVKDGDTWLSYGSDQSGTWKFNGEYDYGAQYAKNYSEAAFYECGLDSILAILARANFDEIKLKDGWYAFDYTDASGELSGGTATYSFKVADGKISDIKFVGIYDGKETYTYHLEYDVSLSEPADVTKLRKQSK